MVDSLCSDLWPNGLSLVLLVIAGRTKTDTSILKQLKDLPMIIIMIMMVKMISSVLSLDGLVAVEANLFSL